MRKLSCIVLFLLLLNACSQKSRNSILETSDVSKSQNKYNLALDTITIYSNRTDLMRSDSIPDSVFEMTNLKSLSITGSDCDFIVTDDEGNDITECWMLGEIPKEIANLNKLEYLQLNVNTIREIPKEIVELKKLKILDLTDNLGLEDIENIVLLENLEELYLFGCHLRKLPNDISRLKKLKKIGLAGNNFNEKEKARIKQALPNCEVTF